MTDLQIKIPSIYRDVLDETAIEHPPLRTRLPETMLARTLARGEDGHHLVLSNQTSRLRSLFEMWADAAGYKLRRRSLGYTLNGSTYWIASAGDLDMEDLPFYSLKSAVICDAHDVSQLAYEAISAACEGTVTALGERSNDWFKPTVKVDAQTVVDYFPDQTMDDIERREKVRGSFGAFFREFEPNDNYIYGRHTLGLIEALDGMLRAVEGGESRYLIVSVPFRHGKSDICERRFPCWTLLRNPAWEVINVAYNYQLASEMGQDARKCYKERVCPLYGRRLSRDQVGAWRLPEGGGLFSAGFGGTVTGRGANVMVIGDYYKNRGEAESIVVRDKVWNSFQSDMMTRRAPVSGVVIVANRWHEDDLVGRIKARNDSGSDLYDPDFPTFEEVRFPAQGDDGWLFEERFSDGWYVAARALLSDYAWNAQAQQEPRPRRGNLLRADLVTVLNGREFEDATLDAHWLRGWDVASTEKERVKDNPDFTVGTRAAFYGGAIYVDDVVREQSTALQREKSMMVAAERDGRDTRVYIETVAGYKDAWVRAKHVLSGFAMVHRFTPTRDKVSRAAAYEALFESGRVFIRRAAWNRAWLDEFRSFPGGDHDDQVDSLDVALHGEINHAAFERQVGYRS